MQARGHSLRRLDLSLVLLNSQSSLQNLSWQEVSRACSVENATIQPEHFRLLTEEPCPQYFSSKLRKFDKRSYCVTHLGDIRGLHFGTRQRHFASLKDTSNGGEAQQDIRDGVSGSVPETTNTENSLEVAQAVERAILEAYRLLHADQVEQAELLLAQALHAAESVLGPLDPLLAQLCDQAALLQFFQGRFKEAELNCLRSLAAAQQLLQEHGRSSAVAMCHLRLGTVLLGREKWPEASNSLETASNGLQDEFGADFQPLHEARFYLILNNLRQNFSEATLKYAEEDLLQAVKGMQNTASVGLHLVRAALREHRALMDTAVASRDWNLAEAILKQALRLQQVSCPRSEEMALTTYQYGTLQYIRGHLGSAEELCKESLALARHLYKKDSHSQVALRLHRIGTMRLAAGKYEEAIEVLSQSTGRLVKNAGEANPLTGESRAALALAQLGQMEETKATANVYAKALIPGRRQQLLAEAREGMSYMEKGFGKDHSLAQKLRAMFNTFASS